MRKRWHFRLDRTKTSDEKFTNQDKKKATPNMEEYVEAVCKLEERTQPVHTSSIASHLRVSLASVTDMLKKMAKANLARYNPYYGVTLTERGKKEGLKLIRKHRLSERFLMDKAGVEWDKVHEEACRFEHVISSEVEEKFSKVLDNPKTCPHGNPIPTVSGEIVEVSSYPITDLEKEEVGTITKITNEAPKFLRYLAALGLFPGTKIKIMGKAPFGGPILTKVGDTNYALGRDVAKEIWVKRSSKQKMEK